VDDASVFWGVIGVSSVLALVVLLSISRGHELGCAFSVVPIVAFGFAGAMFTFILLVSGWNWVTYLVTDGNCAQRQCLFKGEYPQECKLPPLMSSRHCVRKGGLDDQPAPPTARGEEGG
jgi:hypothetical protein